MYVYVKHKLNEDVSSLLMEFFAGQRVSKSRTKIVKSGVITLRVVKDNPSFFDLITSVLIDVT